MLKAVKGANCVLIRQLRRGLGCPGRNSPFVLSRRTNEPSYIFISIKVQAAQTPKLNCTAPRFRVSFVRSGVELIMAGGEIKMPFEAAVSLKKQQRAWIIDGGPAERAAHQRMPLGERATLGGFNCDAKRVHSPSAQLLPSIYSGPKSATEIGLSCTRLSRSFRRLRLCFVSSSAFYFIVER